MRTTPLLLPEKDFLEITWRTKAAYDATQAILYGLNEASNKCEIIGLPRINYHNCMKNNLLTTLENKDSILPIKFSTNRDIDNDSLGVVVEVKPKMNQKGEVLKNSFYFQKI